MKRFKLFTLLPALSLFALAAAAVHADCPTVISGAIFTTNANGTVVNGNIYKNCCDVYLNGGPPPNAPCTSAGLPDGDYYYMVTDPSGKVLLSTDTQAERRFTVKNGVMISAASTTVKCKHNLGVGKCGSPTVSIQLMPFSDTPNPGGEYKAWATPICRYDSANANRNDVGGEKWGFVHKYSKTDNFKCHPPKSCLVNCPANPPNVCADAFPTCTGNVNVPQPTTDCPSPVITAVRSDGVPISYNPSGPYAITGPFPIGETDVTWTVTSSGFAGTVTCLQFVNVIDCDTPFIKCPGDITVCADPTLCTANPDTTPQVHPTCATGAVTSLTVDPPGPYPVGKTKVTWTVTYANGQVDSCFLFVTVKDCEKPKIKCPDNIVHQDKCFPTPIVFEHPVSDNCTSPDKLKVVCKDQNGNTIESGQILDTGEYDVTCTVTDEAGNSDSCTFHISVLPVIPCCAVQALKFNDLDGDSKQGPNEPGIAGVTITFDWTETDGSTHHCVRCTTSDPNTGIVGLTNPVTIPDGSVVTVTETMPSTGNSSCTWQSTTGTVVKFVVNGNSCPPAIPFGNICVCAPSGGFTPGFWSNKNGEAILRANDPAWRNLLGTLCLRDALGNPYFVPGGAFGDDLNPGAYANFRDWLLGSNAVNMAYKLSQMLAASTLNGAYKGLSDSTVLILPANLAACYGKATVTMGEVRTAAKNELCIHGYTPNDPSDPNYKYRSYQECLKNILDGTNNNQIPFLGGNCPIVNPCDPANDSCTP